MKRLLFTLVLSIAFVTGAFSQSHQFQRKQLQAQFDSLSSVGRVYLLAGKVDKLPSLNTCMLQIAEKLHVDSTFAWAYNSIANYFNAKADYSMALEYNFKAIEIANRGFKRISTVLYGNVANIYNKLGNYEAALQYLRDGEKYIMYGTLTTRTYQPSILAVTYVNLKKPDSALKYIQLAFQVNMDHAHSSTKDPRERLINQQLHEAEQNARAAQDEEQRKQNIEYAAIALGIVVFMVLFLLLSRSVIVNTRVIEIVGVIGLLIIFEFINLVVHPYLVTLTNDSPLLMLLILVAIAAIIVPLHHRLEHWIKHKLVEKNKTVRLAAAKRTIEKLEGK